MRRSLRRLILLPVALAPAAVGLVSCGGDDEPERAATAEEGSAFCERAAEAESLGDEVNAAGDDPTKVEDAVTAAIAAGESTVEIAPTDILEVMTRTIEYQQQIADLLAANDWDIVAAYGTDEGAELFSDEAAQADRDEIRAYLEERCGIEDDSDQPADTTPGAAGTDVDLPDGEAGVERFIDLYAIGTGADVTDEQRQCIQDQLRGQVTIEQLELLVGGGVDEDAQIAIGIAFVACDVFQG